LVWGCSFFRTPIMSGMNFKFKAR